MGFDSRRTPDGYTLITHHLDSVASTQDEARARFVDAPVLVTAASQRRGRGRSSAPWIDAPRAVAASLAWRPDWPVETLSLVPLVAGLSALDVLEGGVLLKWPNDLMAGVDKVGGILAEHAEGVVVVGLGVNLWWADPPPGIGSVLAFDPGPDTARAVGEGWANRLLERLAAGPRDWGRDEYRRLCSTIGAGITWEPDGAGVVTDVDSAGRLVVASDRGEVLLDSGEVHTVRRRAD